MGKLSELSQYFCNIAQMHVDIAHTEDKIHFIRRNLDSILLEMKRDGLAFPILNLEPWDFDFSEPESDNLQKNRHIAFSIINIVEDKTNSQQKFDAWEKAEEIGDEILIKILADKREKNPTLSDFRISEARGIPFENKMDGLCGFRYEISLSACRTNEINPNKWL